MDSLFVDNTHQAGFEKDGYLKLDEVFLNDEDIKQLKYFFTTSGIMKPASTGFEVSLEHSNKPLVKEMMQTIHKIVLQRINKLFKNNKVFIASYLGKEFNPKGIVLPHQDWTFIENEKENYSFSCWIPLVDVDINNGCMGMIKGSHEFLNTVRASPAAKVQSPLSSHLFSLVPYINLIPMKAGQLLIFNNRIFHASMPNTTLAYREAIALVFTEKDVAFRHYYLKPKTDNVLLKYEVDIDFFTKYDNKILLKMYNEGKVIEDYKLLEEIEYEAETISQHEMKDKLLAAGNVYNKELEKYVTKLYPEQMNSGIKNKLLNVIKRLNIFNYN